MREGAFSRRFRGSAGDELGLGAVVAQDAHAAAETQVPGDVVLVRASEYPGDLLLLPFRVVRHEQVDTAAEHCLAYARRSEQERAVKSACGHCQDLFLPLKADDVLEYCSVPAFLACGRILYLDCAAHDVAADSEYLRQVICLNDGYPVLLGLRNADGEDTDAASACGSSLHGAD